MRAVIARDLWPVPCPIPRSPPQVPALMCAMPLPDDLDDLDEPDDWDGDPEDDLDPGDPVEAMCLACHAQPGSYRRRLCRTCYDDPKVRQ